MGFSAAVFFGSLCFYGLNVGEEGGTLYLFFRVLRGERPYIDFISGYTPGYFYFHAGLLRLFGEHLLTIRIVLAAIQLTITLLLFRIACTLLSPVAAALAAWIYVASLPVVPGSELSFNVAYPAWYTLAAALCGCWALLRWCSTGRTKWAFLAGLLAALSFGFKPNSGLFQLAAAALVLGVAPWGKRSRLDVVVRWGLLLSALGGVALVLRIHLVGREGAIFFLPLVSLVLASCIRHPGAVSGENPHSSIGWPATLLLAGFLVPSLPWLASYLMELGLSRFTHDVLFVNTGYERFFYEAYRPLRWSYIAIGLGILAMGPATAAIRKGWFGWRTGAVFVVGLIAAGGAALWGAPMVEGFQRSVLQGFQDLSFTVVPLTGWTIVGAVLLNRRIFERTGIEAKHPLSAKAADATVPASLIVVAITASCLLLNAYPRSDFFHLCYSAPLVWILTGWVIQTILGCWRSRLPRTVYTAVCTVVVAGVAVLLGIIAWPQVHIALRVLGHAMGPSRNLVNLAAWRAPVLVEEGLAGRNQRNLAAVARWIEDSTRPDDRIFTFPDLDLVGFLTARRSPARIGYFKSGWPDHHVESEVVDALAAQPPRFVVVANPASLFFADAPAYFFLLRDWLERHYVAVERLGDYRILARRGAPESVLHGLVEEAPSPVPLPLSMEELIRRRQTATAEEVVPLAAEWRQTQFASTDPGLQRFGLRVLGERGDARAAVALVQAPPAVVSPLYDSWAAALYQIALRGILAPYQFGRSPSDIPYVAPLFSLNAGDWQRVREWAQPGSLLPLRFFALWTLVATEREGLVEQVGAMLTDPNPGIRLLGVMGSGRGDSIAAMMSDWPRYLEEIPNLAPSLMLSWAKRVGFPAALAVLQEGWKSRSEQSRSTLAYLYSVLRWPESTEDLETVAREDHAATVRAAARWSLRRVR